MHLSTPSEALKKLSCTSRESGSTLRAIRNGLSTNGADVGTGFGEIFPTVWAIGVGGPEVAAGCAALVGVAGRLVEVGGWLWLWHAARIAESVAALAPSATSLRNRRRSNPARCHSSNSAPN